MFTLSGSMLSGILIVSAVAIAVIGVLRGARLIASRAGQGRVELIRVHPTIPPKRPSRTMRYVVLRPSPQFAFSRSLFSHSLASHALVPARIVQRRRSR